MSNVVHGDGDGAVGVGAAVGVAVGAVVGVGVVVGGKVALWAGVLVGAGLVAGVVVDVGAEVGVTVVAGLGVAAGEPPQAGAASATSTSLAVLTTVCMPPTTAGLGALSGADNREQNAPLGERRLIWRTGHCGPRSYDTGMRFSGSTNGMGTTVALRSPHSEPTRNVEPGADSSVGTQQKPMLRASRGE